MSLRLARVRNRPLITDGRMLLAELFSVGEALCKSDLELLEALLEYCADVDKK